MSSKSSGADWIFSETFKSEKIKTIPYDKKWEAPEGELSSAICHSNLALASNRMLKCRDPNGRRILIIGTSFGNVVVYDRQSGENKKGEFVSMTGSSKLLQAVVRPGEVTEQGMLAILGNRSLGGGIENVGNVTYDIADELSRN